MTGLVENAALALAVLGVLTWLGVVFFAPGERLARIASPGRRADRARAWLYAPFWVPLVLLGATFLSGALADHCLEHPGHVHHLCWVHPPEVSGDLIGWALPIGVAAALLAVWLRTGARAWREWRIVRTLVATSSPSELGQDVRIVDVEAPLALTAGWLRPTILVSRGLLDQISPRSLDILLAHERAHVQRRDTGFAVVDRFAAALLPGAVASPLVGAIRLGREQACDDAAALGPGGVQVARALTEVARARVVACPAGPAPAWAALEERVVHLLDPHDSARGRGLAALAFVAALVVLGAGPGHHVIEHVTTFLLH